MKNVYCSSYFMVASKNEADIIIIKHITIIVIIPQWILLHRI